MTPEVFLKSILDPTFCYIPSLDTDISKTFARIRREQRHGMRMLAKPDREPGKNVSPIARRESGRGVPASFAWRVMDSKKGYLAM
jgi:hypothetical protein